jgi:hypothetical protein
MLYTFLGVLLSLYYTMIYVQPHVWCMSVEYVNAEPSSADAHQIKMKTTYSTGTHQTYG